MATQFTSLLGRVKRWIASEGTATSAKPAAPAASRRRVKERSGSVFVRTIQDMLDENPSLEARLHIVSVTDFREAVGAKWPRLSEKVGLIADNVMRKHIGRGNLFERASEDTFLLLFPNEKREEARRRVITITREISRFLVGGGMIGGERPLALMTNVALVEAVDSEGVIESRVVSAAVDGARSFIPHLGGAPTGGGGGGGKDSPDGNGGMRARWVPIETVRAKDTAGPEWELIQRTRGDAEDETGAPSMPVGAALSLLWRPTWVGEGEAIAAYLARVGRLDRQGAEPLEGSLAYPEKDTVTALALDRFIVGAVVRQMRTGEAAESTAKVIIPLSWRTLTAPDRMSVLSPFADLTSETRASRVAIEVFHIPEDSTEEEIGAVVKVVRSLGCEPMVRMRLSSKKLPDVVPSGVQLIGIDLADLRPDERMGDDHLLQVLDGMLAQAARYGSSCYLWGTRRRRVIGEVMMSGFAMVNGPGLMPDVGAPAVVMPVSREQFNS